MKFTLPTIALFGLVASATAAPTFTKTDAADLGLKAVGTGAGGFAGYHAAHFLTNKMPSNTSYDAVNQASDFLKKNEQYVGYAGGVLGALGGYTISPSVDSISKRSKQAAEACTYYKKESRQRYNQCVKIAKDYFKRKDEQAKADADVKPDAPAASI